MVLVVGEDEEKTALPPSNNLITISKLLVCICLNFQNRHQYVLLKPVKPTFLDRIVDCLSEKKTLQFLPLKHISQINFYFHLVDKVAVG